MKKDKPSSRREFLHMSSLAAAGFTLKASPEIRGMDGTSFRSSEDEQVLFSWDDHSIPWHHNMKVTLVEAEKYEGNPVVKRGPTGHPDAGHAILYGTVIKTGKKFRMWYLAMFESELVGGQAPGSWRPMCYAESDDGKTWVKPSLGLVEFNGDRNNNICLIEGDPHSLTRINDFLSVLYEPEDPNPKRRYKAVYIAHVPREDIHGGLSDVGPKEKAPCMTICATSADGLSWNVVGDRPANAGGERFEASSLYRFGNHYYSSGQLLSPWAWLPDGSEVGRIMLVYRSSDFENWSSAKALGFARPGQRSDPRIVGQQTHMGAGIWNRKNVLVGLYGMWQDGVPAEERPAGAGHLFGTKIDLGLIISNDGIHFREPVPGFKVVATGQPGEWDDVALLQGHAFVNEGDKTMIWYSHWDTGGKLKSMEIGLAMLRRDGFGYLSKMALENEGHFISSSMRVEKGARLWINLEGASAQGPLIIELLDNMDRPIKGFAGADAGMISENGLEQLVVWSGKTDLPHKIEFAIRVTYPMECNAKVYAMYIA